MEYAQLNLAGTDAIQVTTHGNVEWDANHFCPASALTEEESAFFRVVPLLDIAQPAFDTMTQSCFRDGCEQVGDKWQYKWTVANLPPEQAEANQAVALATTLKSYEKALDSHLDGVANKCRFDDRKALSLRAAYPNAWHDLAVAYGTWMDSCNVIAYQGLQDVLDGKRTLPSLDDFISELPAFVWVAP